MLLYPSKSVPIDIAGGSCVELNTVTNMSIVYGIQETTKQRMMVTMTFASFISCFWLFWSFIWLTPLGATLAFDFLTSMKINAFEVVMMLAGPPKHTATMNIVYVILLCQEAKQILCTWLNEYKHHPNIGGRANRRVISQPKLMKSSVRVLENHWL